MPVGYVFLILGLPPLLAWLVRPQLVAGDRLAAYWIGACLALLGVTLVT